MNFKRRLKNNEEKVNLTESGERDGRAVKNRAANV